MKERPIKAEAVVKLPIHCVGFDRVVCVVACRQVQNR